MADISILLGKLSDSNTKIVIRSMKDICKETSDEAFQELKRFLINEQDKNVRSILLQILGDFKNPNSQKLLVETFQKETDIDLKFVAALSLGKVGNKKIVDYLISLLDHEDRIMRYNASNTLEMIGKNALNPLYNTMATSLDIKGDIATTILYRVIKKPSAPFIKFLDPKINRKVIVRAAKILSKYPSEELLNKYISLAKMKDQNITKEITTNLKIIGIHFIDILITRLKTSEEDEIRVISEVLGSYGTDVHKKMLEFLDDSTDIVKKYIIKNLDYKKNPDILAKMVKLIQSDDRNIQKEVAYKMIDIGEDSIFELQKIFDMNDNKDIRFWALYAMAKIGPRGMDFLNEVLLRDDEITRVLAILVFRELNDKQYLSVYMKFMEDPNIFIRENVVVVLKNLGISIIKELIPYISSENEYIKEGVINYLLFFKNEIEDILVDLFKDSDDTTKIFVCGALGVIKSEKAVEFLEKDLNSGNDWIRQYSFETICKIKGTDYIKEYLNGTDEELKWKAADILVENTPEIAAKLLAELISSTSNDERGKIEKLLVRTEQDNILEELMRKSDNDIVKHVLLKVVREIRRPNV